MKVYQIIKKLSLFKPTDDVYFKSDDKELAVSDITRKRTDNSRMIEHRAVLVTESPNE